MKPRVVSKRERVLFLTAASIKIFALGALSFMISTAGGVLIAKLINCFLKPGNKYSGKQKLDRG